MKKTFLLLIITTLFTMNVSAQSLWMSTDFGFSRGYETATVNDTDSNIAVNSVGADLFMYIIDYYEDIGFYFQSSFYIPQTARLGTASSGEAVNYKNHTFITHISFNLGPAFRLKISDKWDTLFGFGLHVLILISEYDQYFSGYGYKDISVSGVNLGIASNLSLNYYLDSEIYITMGLTFAYDFFNNYTVTINYDSKDYTPESYSYMLLNPFIGFGIFIE